ncbi:hypothetical protein ACOIYL_004467 [Vibrio parahaemolyticus]|nr:hypothetical protein [Vibrio cidicii]HCE3205317.1 hypothetical protein [Vibrio parahaemolyticus]HCE3314886.1 hypothetical protein [Vibrio parahaemolyticus]HCG8169847.1 hypothetical protein [Vibrio parahaemolyticus]HCG9589743.1 hypothetical protein [Vibrio parahaemolyticus]
MSNYTPFWKSEFQRCLTSLNGKGNILHWDEISEVIEEYEGIPIWEYVYEVHLKTPAATILVFSSVYKNDDRSREVNSDAVRLVYRWETQNGVLYAKIAKKYRVESLFENLASELIAASNDCFDLGKYNWTNSWS